MPADVVCVMRAGGRRRGRDESLVGEAELGLSTQHVHQRSDDRCTGRHSTCASRPVEPLDDQREVTSSYRRTRTVNRGPRRLDGYFVPGSSLGQRRRRLDAQWQMFNDVWKEAILSGSFYNSNRPSGPWGQAAAGGRLGATAATAGAMAPSGRMAVLAGAVDGGWNGGWPGGQRRLAMAAGQRRLESQRPSGNGAMALAARRQQRTATQQEYLVATATRRRGANRGPTCSSRSSQRSPSATKWISTRSMYRPSCRSAGRSRRQSPGRRPWRSAVVRIASTSISGVPMTFALLTITSGISVSTSLRTSCAFGAMNASTPGRSLRFDRGGHFVERPLDRLTRRFDHVLDDQERTGDEHHREHRQERAAGPQAASRRRRPSSAARHRPSRSASAFSAR